MKNILVIHTGGTIAMSEDRNTGAVKPNLENPLHETIMNIEGVQVDVEDFLNVPSPHITPSHMITLSKRINYCLNDEDYDGVVVTHGTDTLEETAYFLDLTVRSNKPIVVTGAMRSSNELGSDGPHNLISSIHTAMSDSALDKGVLVVLNDEIHTAKNVTKTHTSNIATFQSPQYGPIGIVTKRGVLFHHSPSHRDQYNIEEVDHQVLLIKVVAGMENSIFEALCSIKVDGIVIEALGQGNLPPETIEPLVKLIDKGIPVVLVSRCFNGIVQDIYGYDGGGKQLKDLGVIFTNGLNGQKARIKLMVALEQTHDPKKIQGFFQQ
ncbi:asparaginase [Bacillus shivajii]|uniref:asparaginase n=1 Tax=Bacillus shivajii TaxID=1983719 RepID=UPI001CF9A63C|nr:asparaginase [Bacillus shivajii]UCZ54747.1 asparaginase [Bacillus shivajii]